MSKEEDALMTVEGMLIVKMVLVIEEIVGPMTPAQKTDVMSRLAGFLMATVEQRHQNKIPWRREQENLLFDACLKALGRGQPQP